jgi:hypothetical protein
VTPKEASAAFRKLQREIGPKFNVHINLETDGDAPLSGWASSGDGHWRKVMDVHADDFATLIQSRQEVTAKECREAIPEARAKQVFNALAYLTRRKMIHRDGYGKYRALVALYPRDPS